MTTLYDPGPCRWCLNPRHKHPIYTALEGDHHWEPDIGPDTGGSTEPRGCHCATDGRGEHACDPTPSDRLPASARTVTVSAPVSIPARTRPEPPRAPRAGIDRVDEAMQQTPEQLAATEERLREMGKQVQASDDRPWWRRILNARRSK